MDIAAGIFLILLIGAGYAVIDRLIQHLDGYVYLRGLLILIAALSGSLAFFMEWNTLERFFYELNIIGLAVMFFLPLYLFIKLIFFAIDRPYKSGLAPPGEDQEDNKPDNSGDHT